MKSGRIYSLVAFGIAAAVLAFSPIGYIRPERLRWAALLTNTVVVSFMSGIFVLAVGAPGLLRTWVRWLSYYTAWVLLLGVFLWVLNHHSV